MERRTSADDTNIWDSRPQIPPPNTVETVFFEPVTPSRLLLRWSEELLTLLPLSTQ